MTENEFRKFLKEQDAVYKKAEDVLRARGVDVISVDYIEQCGTSDVKISFAFRWGKVAEHDCIVIPMSDFVEPENKGETPMTEETKMEALDELFKEWLAIRFPKESGFRPNINLTYNSFNDEAKAEFGEWLLDRYSSKCKKESTRVKA